MPLEAIILSEFRGVMLCKFDFKSWQSLAGCQKGFNLSKFSFFICEVANFQTDCANLK